MIHYINIMGMEVQITLAKNLLSGDFALQRCKHASPTGEATGVASCYFRPWAMVEEESCTVGAI